MFKLEKREPRKTLTIGFVGRLLPEKGLLILVDALNKIKSDDWRLLVVGDGDDRANAEKRLAEYGLTERVKFVGAVSYDDTPAYFRQMDVLIVPTRTTGKIREQFGRVIVEAMAAGVPVVGSTCGAIPEVIGDAGLIFEENNSVKLAAALRKILIDKDLRERFARAGRLRVEQNYTWERVAEKIFALYCHVLKTDVSVTN